MFAGECRSHRSSSWPSRSWCCASGRPTAVAEDEPPPVGVDGALRTMPVAELRVEPLELELATDMFRSRRLGPWRNVARNAVAGFAPVRFARRGSASCLPLVRHARQTCLLAPSSYVHSQCTASRSATVKAAAREHVLVLAGDDGPRSPTAFPTTEPVFGICRPRGSPSNSPIITAAPRAPTVVDRSSVLVTHLSDVVRRKCRFVALGVRDVATTHRRTADERGRRCSKTSAAKRRVVGPRSTQSCERCWMNMVPIREPDPQFSRP